MQLLTSSFAAYAFAKLEFKGRNALFLGYVATIAMPWQVYMVPQFMMMRSFGLNNTHLAIICLQAFSAFGVFLMRQFYMGVPDELCEAARIDGMNEYKIWALIMLPLSKPALSTLTIFTFVNTWNDFLGPLLYLTKMELKTVQIGLRMFISQYSSEYGLIMAASVVALFRCSSSSWHCRVLCPRVALWRRVGNDKIQYFNRRKSVSSMTECHRWLCCPAGDSGTSLVAGVVAQSFLFNLRWDMEQTQEPVVFDGDIDWLHQPGDDSEWVFAFNRMRYWICLGQAYAHSGDERYARTFASQLCHWIRTVRRDDPACAKAWRSIEAGLRMEYWTKAMQYFSDSPAITDEVMTCYLTSVADHAEFLSSVWGSYHLMSNWGVLENHGLFLASLALEDSELSRRYTAEALRRLALEIDIQVYDDGMQWEQSPMYHNEVTHCYLDVVLLSHRLGLKLPPIIEEKTHLMSSRRPRLAERRWHSADDGDSDRIDQRDIITKAAYIFSDRQLKAAGYEHLDFDSVWDLGFEAIEAYDRLARSEKPQGLCVLGESGNAFYHHNGLYVRFHCGTLGAGHGHSDKLHLDLFANGEDILIDPGRYTYVDKPERYEFKDSTAHNTTTVDNLNFTICTDSWECSKLSAPIGFKAVEKRALVALQGSHQGYLDRNVLPRRTITILSERLILVSDVFIAQGEHSYQSHWHFNDSGAVHITDGERTFPAPRTVSSSNSLAHPVKRTIKETRLSRRYNEAVDNKTLSWRWRPTALLCTH